MRTLMNRSWICEKAEDYCDSVRDGTHDSPKQVSQGYKLITSKHIVDGVIDDRSAYCISATDYESISKRSGVDVDDILFSMIGTVGRVCRIEEKPDFAIKNLGLFKLSDPLKSKYLFFYFQSSIARNYINRVMAGSTQSYISLKSLREFPIWHPVNSSEMSEIVAILDSLESKRKVNLQINDYLAA